jgi:hypothetical protein
MKQEKKNRNCGIKIENKKRSSRFSRISCVLISCFIITILVLSSPAKASGMSLNIDDTSVTKGQEVNFSASIKVLDTDNIQKFVLNLHNTKTGEDILCNFNEDGSIISGCDDMTIEKMQTLNSLSSSYGYGYGYGYGNEETLSYHIVLDTTDYDAGDYDTKLSAFVGDAVVSENGDVLTIKKKTVGGMGMSSNYNQSAIDEICLDAWKCTVWSACDAGFEYRTCGQTRSDCMTTPRPAETRECNSAIKLGVNNVNTNGYDNINLGGSSGSENHSDSIIKISEQNIGQNPYPGITAAVIGTFGNSQGVVILLLSLGIGICAAVIVLISLGSVRRTNRARELNRIMYKPSVE